MLMNLRTSIFMTLALFGLLHAQAVRATERFPGASWEQTEPDAAGWSKQKLEKAENWSREIGSTAVMIVHRGALIAELMDWHALELGAELSDCPHKV
jgi:hypothetical protein